MPAGSDSAHEVIGDRYRVVRELGRGGMAVAYEVEDLAKGETLALKRLLDPREKVRAEVSLLFEQEFHSLAQLAHPCVVEVRDFDRDLAGRPFYTMELLRGEDLRTRSPLPWQRVCVLLNDLGSALALLHSRRLLHRDLTPRNVQCMPDGSHKLLDFGAVAPFGPCRHVVGTPPYCPPEAVSRQPLDGQSDLFSLGASAYFALTGRVAFPARRFSDLRDAWRSPPRLPSQVVEGVPGALDELVMSLLDLERTRRPGSAAEVMERACVIGGIDQSEQRVVPQAYLATPTLVERAEEMARVRKLLVRNMRGRGCRLLVSGEPGMGRSRLTAACALEGKLLGAVVLAVDASDARAGDFSAARELVRQLFEAQPAQAHALPPGERELLERLWPELFPSAAASVATRAPADVAVAPPVSSLPPPDKNEAASAELAVLRPKLQVALQQMFLRASKSRALLLVIDDLHELDEPSAALVALLSDVALVNRLAIVASAPRDAVDGAEGALGLFAQSAGLIKVRPLSAQGSHDLLASMFGEVPHLQLLADRLHVLASGAPGGLMELAQHLLHNGTLRYEAGAWRLPSELPDHQLPTSLNQAFALKLQALSPGALHVAQSIALSPGLYVGIDSLLELSQSTSERALLADLDQLIGQQIVDVNAGAYGLRSSTLRKLLLHRLDPEDARALHRRIARRLARHDPHSQATVHQWIAAGDLEAALDALLGGFQGGSERPVDGLMAIARGLSPGWQDRFRALAQHCQDSGRPRRDYIKVLMSMLGFVALMGSQRFDGFELLDAVLQQGAHDCGLDIHAQLTDVPQAERLGRALELAQRRYEETPEDQRVWTPAEAIPRLARAVVQSIGIYGGRNDPALFASVPSIAPLVPLARSLWVIHENFLSAIDLANGRFHRAQGVIEALLEDLGEPGSGGADEPHLKYMRLGIRYSACAIAAAYGQPAPDGYLESLEADPIFEVNAARLRMILALRRGDLAAADVHRHEAELLRVQNSPPQMFEGSHLASEYTAYVFYGDLARLKQILPQIEAKASRVPGWRPILCHASGEYQLLRGDLVQAQAAFAEAMELAPKGREVLFCDAASGLVRVLLRRGKASDACERARAWIAQAEPQDFGPSMHSLYGVAAMAHSAAGEHERAEALADRAIEVLEQMGAGGTLLGAAHECAARVGFEADDLERFHRHAARCASYYRPQDSPLLAARYQALLDLARAGSDEDAAPWDPAREQAPSRIELVLTQCHGSQERAERALATVVEQLGCEGGFFYLMKRGGPELVAQIVGKAVPQDLDTQVVQYLEAEVEGGDDVTLTALDLAIDAHGESMQGWEASDGGRFYPSLIAHVTPRGLEITGLIALQHRQPDKALLGAGVSATISRALSEAGDVVTVLAAS